MDKITYLLLAAAIVAVFGIQIKQKMDLKKAMANCTDPIEHSGVDKSQKIIAYGGLAFGVLLVGMFLVDPFKIEDAKECALLSCVLIAMFASMLYNLDYYSGVYYTKKGMFVKSEYVLFKQISRVDMNDRKQGPVVKLVNGKTYRVNRTQAAKMKKVCGR